MAHTISTEPRAALSEDAVEAVQVCTGEFLSLLVSEARQRVAREGRDAVTEADLLAVLNTLGFRGFTDSLKSHLQRCAAEDAQARAAPGKAPGGPRPAHARQAGPTLQAQASKRQRTEPGEARPSEPGQSSSDAGPAPAFAAPAPATQPRHAAGVDGSPAAPLAPGSLPSSTDEAAAPEPAAGVLPATAAASQPAPPGAISAME